MGTGTEIQSGPGPLHALTLGSPSLAEEVSYQLKASKILEPLSFLRIFKFLGKYERGASTFNICA